MFNIVDLKSVCDIQSGGTPSRNENSFYNGNVKWAKISDLEKAGDGFIYDTEEYISESGLKDIRNRIFEVDTLFFAMYGSVGKTAITKDKMSCNQAILGITVNNTNLIDLKYLKYYFELTKEKLINSARGVALKNLSAGLIKELKIPLPPLETQKRIAQILDDGAALRDKTRQLIKEYDALAQSIFLDMFGDPIHNSKKWNLVKFSEVGKLDRGKSKHRPRNAPELLNGSYPLIQTGDIANADRYIYSYKSTYSEIGLKQSRMWPAGTLCITIAANIAKTGILSFDACFPDSVVGFIPNEKTNNLYVQYWMSFLQAMIEENAPMAAQKNINLTILKNLDFMLPSITLQNQFAEKIALIEQQKELAKQELKESEDLFNCLLQKAFKGELVQ